MEKSEMTVKKQGVRALPRIILFSFGIPATGSILYMISLVYFGADNWMLFIVPGFTALLYVLFRKLLTPAVTTANLIMTAVYALIYTIAMLVSGGSVYSLLAISAGVLAFLPYPGILLLMLLQNIALVAAASFGFSLVNTWLSLLLQRPLRSFRSRVFRAALAGTLVFLALFFVDFRLYQNRPEVRYSGHGFDYMNGWSSTDFSDYTVYSEPSKLAALDHPASFHIEKESDMPVMDGAEACYPLYAAIAKAVYQDIDRIEKNYADTHPGRENAQNGKIVTFTNTIQGFYRLVSPYIMGMTRVELFFGARPSKDQLDMADAEGAKLKITPIGREAFVFFVEPDNPVTDLKADDIRKIYSGEITNWSQLGGKNQMIRAFQRPQNSGSQTMMQYFMGDTPLKEPMTYEVVGAMEGIIRKVAQYNNENGAMGYSFRYFVEDLQQENDVRVLSVDGVAPTLENIENGSYPLTVDLCLITLEDAKNPYVEKMIEYCLSEEGQEIIGKTGYGRLKPE